MADKCLILIVDDNPQNIQYLGNFLSEQGYALGVAQDGDQALEFVRNKQPALILLDVLMPKMNGYEVCKMLKKEDYLRSVPVIFLTAKSSTTDIVTGFEAGGVDYITKPFVPEELLARVQTHLEIVKLRSEVEYLANHDALTGLPSLRLATDRLKIALSNARRNESKVALLFLDLDGFKTVNDSYGHEAGDVVLQTIAERIRGVIREGDTCCRVGGDEFMIILCGATDNSSIKGVSKRLILEVNTAVDYQGHELSVGVSIGIAVYPDHADDAEALKRRADDIMYEVKAAGKNNYFFAEVE